VKNRQLLSIVALVTVMAPGAKASSISWGHDYKAALKTARTEHKLVMVDFYTSWCTWCKRLDKITYPAAVVQKAMLQVIPVKLNAETNGSVQAKQFGVSAYPDIVFVAPSGKMISAILGYEDPAPFANDINKVITTFKTTSLEIPELKKGLAAQPKNVALLQKAISVYSQISDFGAATSAADKLKTVDEAVYPASLEVIAEAYQNLGRYDSAQPLFKRIITTASDVNLAAEARVNLAITYMQQGSADPAKKLLNEVVGNSAVSKNLRSSAQSILKQFSN
jgi:thioredoxin-like negative regulator of GroEL